MYQLVAMESESSSFWWDSVDSSVNLNDDHLEDADQMIVEGVDGTLRVKISKCTSNVAIKDDFGYSTTRKFVVEDVVNSGQKMAEEALFLVK